MEKQNILQRIFGINKRAFIPTMVPVGNNFSFFGGANLANVTVSSESALKVSTFYSCVRSISEDIAKLPFVVQLKDSNGNKTDQPFHPATQLFNQTPNGFSTPFTLKQTLFERALRKGNGYAYIERNNDAEPIAIYFIENEYVIPILKDRKLIYNVTDPILGLTEMVKGEDMFHIRGFGDAYIGKSVIQYASESIANGIALQDYGNKFFSGGGGMLGLITTKGMQNENSAKAFKKSFTDSLQEDNIGFINGDATFTKMSVAPNEAQFIESSDAKVNDIARWFRMPLGKLQKDSVSNIEALEIQYVQDTLMPWIVRFEQECEAKLFTKKERPVMDAKIVTSALLRGDSAAVERRVKTMFYVGAQSPNQILRSLDMNGIGPEGDKRYLPVNMIPASQVEKFWEGKDNSQATQTGADASGSGANNNNISQ